MSKRDHILIATVAAGLVVANVLLGSVLDVSPHSWVTAAWAATFGGLALTGLFLISAAVAVPWTIVTHCLRRLLRRTVPASTRTRAGYEGPLPRPTRPARVAATGRPPERIGDDTETRLRTQADLWVSGQPATVPPRHASHVTPEVLTEDGDLGEAWAARMAAAASRRAA